MIGAESLLGRPDLETTRKGHTRAAPEAQKRARGWRRFCSLLGHVSANSEQPQRKIARASLPAVNYTTTERAVFLLSSILLRRKMPMRISWTTSS
jgi:hypothetical protein